MPSDFALPDDVHSICDLSLEQLKALASAIECFSGVTTAQPGGDSAATTLSWHGAFLYPPQLGDGHDPLQVLASVEAGTHVTADVGSAVPTPPTSRSERVGRWLEHALDRSYEEEWLLLKGYVKQGAALAATRPAQGGCGACHLLILGSTFGFVRDIDRASLPAAVRNRPLADVLEDAAVPLNAKQRLMDCEFSFGFFGQNGKVGGVVERSSLPWRAGVALATILEEVGVGWQSTTVTPLHNRYAVGWSSVRAPDAAALEAVLKAVHEDHEKASEALREAEANGQAAVAEVLRARGAVAS